MPSKKSMKRATKKRPSSKRKGRKTSKHHQTDVWGVSSVGYGAYPGGGYVASGLGGMRYQGRYPVGALDVAKAPVAAPVEAPVVEVSAAAATSGDVVAQQRAVRTAMQRVLRDL